MRESTGSRLPARRRGRPWLRVRDALADAAPTLGWCVLGYGLIAYGCAVEAQGHGRDAKSASADPYALDEKPPASASSSQADTLGSLMPPELLRRAMHLPQSARAKLVAVVAAAPKEVEPPTPPPPAPWQVQGALAKSSPTPAGEPPEEDESDADAIEVAAVAPTPPVIVAEVDVIASPPPPKTAPPPSPPKTAPPPSPPKTAPPPAPPLPASPKPAAQVAHPEPAPEPAPTVAVAPPVKPSPAPPPAPPPETKPAAPTPAPAATQPAPSPSSEQAAGSDRTPPNSDAPSAPAPVASAEPTAEGKPALERPGPTRKLPEFTKRIDRPRRPTPMPPQDATRYLAQAWQQVSGEVATPQIISVFWAQWALETGRGRWMVDYNYAGLKGRAPDGGTAKWSTWEETEKGPKRVRSRFRNYETAEEGAYDYIHLLWRLYPLAIQAARRGDAATFIVELDKGGFFTERPEHYLRSVISLAREFMREQRAARF